MTHLDALNLRLSHERDRLASANSTQERKLRGVWIAQIEREIQAEHLFLAKTAPTLNLSDDDLFRELSA